MIIVTIMSNGFQGKELSDILRVYVLVTIIIDDINYTAVRFYPGLFLLTVIQSIFLSVFEELDKVTRLDNWVLYIAFINVAYYVM